MLQNKMRYAVVSFDDTDETDFLPLAWMTDRTALLDVSSLINNKSIVTFYWPPFKNVTRLTKSKRDCLEPEIGWPIYPCRILSTAGNELEARQKCKYAEFSSNVDEISDKPKRSRTKKLAYSSSSSAEEDASDEIRCTDRPTKRKCTGAETLTEITNRSCKRSLKLQTAGITTMSKPSAPSAPHRPATMTTKTGQLSRSISTPVCEDESDDIAGLPGTRVDNAEDSSERFSTNTVQRASPVAGSSRQSSRQFETPTGEVCHDAIRQYSGPPAASKTPVTQTTGGDLNSRLMLKILASLEDLRQTQKLHSSMLQSVLRQMNAAGGLAATELPEDVQFPLETEEDLKNMEDKLLDLSTMKVLIQVLVDNGGSDLREFVKRNMRFILGNSLARQFNVTGQRRKKAFKSLKLFDILYGAVKQNISTKDSTKKMVEDELAVWFGNARDRGTGSRRILKSAQFKESESISTDPHQEFTADDIVE